MLNVIIYAAVLPYWFVTLSVGPGFGAWGAITGNNTLLNWGNALTTLLPTTNNLWIVVIGEVLTLIVMVLYIVLKPRLAFNLFSALLLIELLGLIVSVVLLLAMGHGGFVTTVNNFMANQGYVGNYYSDVSTYGATFGPYGSDATNTILFVPLIFAFYFMFTTAPSYIAGEFRRSSRTVRIGMSTSFVLAVVFSVAIIYAFEQVVGMNFLNGVVANSLYFLGGPQPLNFGPGLTSLPMLAAGGNNVALAVIFLGSVTWYLLWIILGLYIFSRYALSYSLDRLFPRFMSSVTRSTHAPIGGIVVVSLLGVVLLPFLVYYPADLYTPFVFLLFFLPMITVALTSLSLLRLGIKDRKIFYAAAGAISTGVTVVSAYLVTTLPLLGSAAGFTPSNRETGYIALVALLVIGAVWYVAARAYHQRRSGIDIAMAFKELPPD
jgi:amino acid transporter